jgi:hypothetical protein
VSDSPIKVISIESSIGGDLAAAERVAEQYLPDLEALYGQLYPVTNIDGSVSFYDANGDAVAEITPDGELVEYCEPPPPPPPPEAKEDYCDGVSDEWAWWEDWYDGECDWETQSCMPDDGEAVQQGAKKFSESSDAYTEELKPSSQDDVDAPKLEEPLRSPEPEMERDYDREDVSGPLDEPEPAEKATNPQEGGAAGAQAGEGKPPQGTEPAGVIHAPAAGSGNAFPAVAMQNEKVLPDACARALGRDGAMHAAGPQAGDSPRMDGDRPHERDVGDAAIASGMAMCRMADDLTAAVTPQAQPPPAQRTKLSTGPELSTADAAGASSGARFAPAGRRGRGRSAEGAEATRGDRPAPARPVVQGGAVAVLAGGEALLDDQNANPFAIARDQASKCGPPYFTLFQQGDSSSAVALRHEARDEKVVSVHGQGDSRDHHDGRDDGDHREELFRQWQDEVEEIA